MGILRAGQFLISLRATKIFLAQILVSVAVVFLFKFFAEDKRTAGLIAGTLFVAIGLVVPIVLYRARAHWTSLSFYGALAHLLLSALPMVGYRLANFSKDFTQILIFGMPGHVFHYYAQKIYLGFMLATVIDIVLASLLHWRRRKKSRSAIADRPN